MKTSSQLFYYFMVKSKSVDLKLIKRGIDTWKKNGREREGHLLHPVNASE